MNSEPQSGVCLPPPPRLLVRDLLRTRGALAAEVRSLVGNPDDAERFYLFCLYALRLCTCRACLYNGEPVVERGRKKCPRCGAAVSGQGLRRDPHFKVCRFICEWGEDVDSKLLLLPRGSYKSTIIRAYAIWVVLHDPDVRVLVDTETARLASSALRFIKATFEDAWFRECYGDWCAPETLSGRVKKAVGWREDRLTVTRRTRPRPEATFELASIETGLTGHHYDLILPDDIVGNSNYATEDARAKVREHAKQLGPLGDPGCRYIMSGTRWHLDDVYGWILNNPDIRRGYDTMIEPAIHEDGSLFFPQVLTQKFLDLRRSRDGEEFFQRQYMNNPIVAEKTLGAPKRYFTDADWSAATLRVVTATDPASASEHSTSKTGMVVVGIDEFGNLWVREALEANIPHDQTIEQIFLWAERYKPYKTLVEKLGNDSLYQTIQREMRLRKWYFPVESVTYSGRQHKEDRIRFALQPAYAGGRVFHHESLRGGSLERQLLNFGSMDRDDVVDALAHAFEGLRGPASIAKPVEDDSKITHPMDAQTFAAWSAKYGGRPNRRAGVLQDMRFRRHATHAVS